MARTLLIVLLIILEGLCTLFDPEYNHFKVHRLEKCQDEGTNPKFDGIFIRMVNFRVTHQDNINVHFTGFIDIRQPVQINFRLAVHGLICDGKSDRICRHSFIRKFGYICSKLHEPDRPWHQFIKKSFSCPIPPGYYDLGNVTMNINSISYLPLNEGYWVIKVFGYAGSDVVMCEYAEMEIIDITKSTTTEASRRHRLI